MKRTSKEELERRDAKLIAALSEAAEKGLPCPTNSELNAVIDHLHADMALVRLERQGQIKRDTRPDRARRIFVAATGKWTAYSAGFSTVESNSFRDVNPCKSKQDERALKRLPAGGFGGSSYQRAVNHYGTKGRVFRKETHVYGASTAEWAARGEAA